MSGIGLAHRVTYGHGGLSNVQVVEEKQVQKGTAGHMRILVVLVMFLLVMMIASIIISVVSLSDRNHKDYGYDHSYDRNYEKHEPHPNYEKPVSVINNIGDTSKEEHVYTIAFGSDWGNHQYIDEGEQCALRGWGLEVVLAACEAAHLTCKTVYAPYDWCIDYFTPDRYKDHPVIGKGLLNDGITACAGWYPDPERYNLLKFSTGYIRNPDIFLWYLSGTPRPASITSSTRIGFVYSVTSDEKCLKRYLGNLANAAVNADLRPYSGGAAAAEALGRNEIDLVFLSDLLPRVGVTKWSETPMICASGPAGLVSNKKNKPFLETFSKGIELIKGNGVMKKICEKYNTNWCVDYYWA